ncbi:MAG: hypothetical protein WD249_03645 [Gaiellaceae bacterium]
MKAPTPESFWVEAGTLLAGKYPARRLEALLDAGVGTFVDLTEADELDPYVELLPDRAVHRRFPVPDIACPLADQVAAILDYIDERLAQGVVYLHCRGGCGRTGVVVGCWLVRQGASPEDALARVHELTRALWSKPCPETRAQIEMVTAWAER